MSFSPQWDTAYRAGSHLSRWPWSDLVSFVYRHAKPADGFHTVLELGCGVGANIPFFLSLGVDYYAVEGSQSAVAHAVAAYPNLAGKIAAGDFTRGIVFAGPFDLVVDRAALIHNSTEAMLRALRMVGAKLRPGGKLIGIDWFSSEHEDAVHGDEVDSHTRRNLGAGPFAGVGNVHFCDEKHLADLLSKAGLKLELLEHKRTEIVFPSKRDHFGYWNFVAVKP
jgi:SAM-dependent methyltransferase